MNIRRLPGKQKQGWAPIVIFGFGAAALALLYLAWPEKHSLLLFGIYTIPSHILISPFPHEPMLLWVAKFEPPWAVAAMGTVGACLAGYFDYALLVPLLSHYAVRSRYERSRFYLKSLQLFKRFPFCFLVVAGLSPLPFFPFKFISIAGGYPLWKYQAALIVGRAPRYYLLAWFGKELHFPDWLLVFLAAVLFISGIINIFKRFVFRKPQEEAAPISPASGGAAVAKCDHDQPNGGKKMQRFSRTGTLPILAGIANNHLRNLPLVVSFEVTLSCPANCRHCDTGGIKPGEERLRPEEYRRYIEELRPVFVQLSGGEPLLRPDLPEIARAVKGGRRLPYLIVVSNGFLLNERKYLALKEAGADRFSISLDFPDARHDDFRRLPGLYAHLEQLIPRLAAYGNEDVTLNTAITSANLPVLRELAARAAEWGVAISYSAYSALRTSDPRYLVSSAEDLTTLEETIEDLIRIRRRQGGILNPSSVLRDTCRYFKEGGLPGCSAGRRFLVVRPDGMLNGCSMHRERRYARRQDLLRDFCSGNDCRGCFVAIRAYTDKSLWSLAGDAMEAARL